MNASVCRNVRNIVISATTINNNKNKNIAPIYIAYKSGKSCHNYWLYGHHLQQTLINIHITSIQFTTILFIGMQLSRLFPWWVHNLRYDTAFLPFLTRTLNMIFIVQHLTKLQIFTKIGMHSKNSTKASFTTYNRRSVAMKPNPYLQYSLVQNKALKSCWSSNLTHRPPHLLMLSNLLILIANLLVHFPCLLPRPMCLSHVLSQRLQKHFHFFRFLPSCWNLPGVWQFLKKAELRLSSTPESFRTVLSLSILWTAFIGPWRKKLGSLLFFSALRSTTSPILGDFKTAPLFSSTYASPLNSLHQSLSRTSSLGTISLSLLNSGSLDFWTRTCRQELSTPPHSVCLTPQKDLCPIP